MVVAGTVGPLMFVVFVKFIGLVSRLSMLEYEIRSSLHRMICLNLLMKHIHKAWDI